jgi:two-component system sensor histidine kinase RstB
VIRFFLRFHLAVALGHLVAVLLWMIIASWTAQDDLHKQGVTFFDAPSAWATAQLRGADDPAQSLSQVSRVLGWPASLRAQGPDDDEVHIEASLPEVQVLRRVDEQRWLQLGPLRILPEGAPGRWLGLAVFAFGGAAIGVFVQLRPVERDLTHLERVARRVGQGDLSARAQLAGEGPVAELAHTFDQMTAALARLIESQRETLRGVSHELRTPLARLRFALEELVEIEDPEERRRQGDQAAQDIEQLDGLIQELLAYMRLEQEPSEGGHCEALPVLQRVAEEEASLRTSVRFEVHGASQQLAVEERLLRRAVRNLVANARRHARTQVWITLTGGHIVVEDDGSGVRTAELGRLGLPFVRGEGGRALDPTGSGLGLAITRRIAETHGGTLAFTSSPHGGLRATLSLPLYSQPTK